MLHKIKNKPPIYQLWTTTVVLCALYCLLKYFFLGLGFFDYLVQAYVFISIIIDFFMDPRKEDK